MQANFLSNKFQYLMLLGLVILLAVSYRNLIDLWWMFDDSQHLKLVSLTGLKVFTQTAAEVGYIPANFTPWLFLNYWIDLSLFGLDPRGAHAHQLVSLSFTAIAAFYLLKRIMIPVVAIGTLLFFFSTPVAHTVIHILCTRHYLEGLGYACLGLAFFLKHRDSGLLFHLILSLVFSFIAFLNKEVYLPLVGIVACVSAFDFIETKKSDKIIPAFFFTLATIAYFCYRGYALGWENLFKGYGDNVVHKGPAEILDYLKEVIAFNQLGFLVAVLLLLFLGYAVPKIKQGVGIYTQVKFLILFTLALVCILAPVYKVMPTSNINHNYIFLATFSIVVATGYFLSKILRLYLSYIANATTALIFLAMVYVQQSIALPKAPLNTQNSTAQIFDKYKVEGMYLLYSLDSAAHSLIDAAGAPWHQSGLVDLRASYLKLPPGPSVCNEVCPCTENGPVYRYNNGALVELKRFELKCDLE